MTAGAEYRDVYRIRQRNFVADPFQSYIDATRDSATWGVYLQDEIRIADGLLFGAGVRHDHYESFGGTTTPRGSLIWSPSPSTALKLIYGQAYRAPTPFELYWNDGGLSWKENPGLRPERIHTLEGIWEQGIGESLRFTLSAYEFRIRNLVVVETDPADGLDTPVNRGKARGRGIEAGLAGKWESGHEGRLSGTLQRTEDEDTGERLPNSPPYTLKANGISPLWGDRLFAGLEGQYVARRQPVRPVHSTPAGGYAVVNLTLFGKALLPGLDVSATAYNLFDRGHADLGGPEHRQELIPQDGRSFRIKATAAF
jgi:iron complex outermembrane receptor protein